MQWRYLLHTFLDTLMPERPSACLVRMATIESVRAHLAPRVVDGVTALLPYHEPIAKAIITETKFHHNDRAARLMAAVVTEYLSQQPTPIDIVLPIPLSRKRERERGYNQVTTVLERVPGLVLERNVLIKVRHTTAQTKLGRAERLQNTQGVFALMSPSRLTDKHVCVVDDVLTTGATLAAAAHTVEAAYPRTLTLLAFAH